MGEEITEGFLGEDRKRKGKRKYHNSILFRNIFFLKKYDERQKNKAHTSDIKDIHGLKYGL